MASPWKHPKTGVYWFRRRVPDALRSVVGKTIVQKTLDTKDPAEAKRRFLPVAAAIDREWTRLAAAEEITPPRKRDRFTPKQVLGIAGEFYRWMVSKHDGNPGKVEKWREEVEKDRRFIVPPQTKLKGLNWVTGGPVRIPTKPASNSNMKPATDSEMKPARVPI